MDLTLAHQLSKLVHDPSPIIRMELVFVLSSLIYYQQEEFREYQTRQKQLKKEQKRMKKEEEQRERQQHHLGGGGGGGKLKKSHSNVGRMNTRTGRLKPKKPAMGNMGNRSAQDMDQFVMKSKSLRGDRDSRTDSVSVHDHHHPPSHRKHKGSDSLDILNFDQKWRTQHTTQSNHVSSTNKPDGPPPPSTALQFTESAPPIRKNTRPIPPAPKRPPQMNGNASSSFSTENLVSPMIQPIQPVDHSRIPPTAEESVHNLDGVDLKESELNGLDEPSVSLADLKEQEHEQRKRIWEVIKVLSKDPIAEISRTANKVRMYMTSDKVKSARSRALSDPEKHAKMLLDGQKTAKSNPSQMIGNNAIHKRPPQPRPHSTRVAGRHKVHGFNEADSSANSKNKGPHKKTNTILGALSSGIGRKENGKKPKQKKDKNTKQSQHGKQQTLPQIQPIRTASPSKRNPKGRSVFSFNGESSESKENDPHWNIPNSPLFSWLTEYITRPLTNAMYDAPDPLYHELDPKNLPMIDPRLTMSNFFYHQEQQRYGVSNRYFMDYLV